MKSFKEFCSEALKSSVVQAAARQRYVRQGIQKQVGNTNPRPRISQPRTITGFQTARGSKYTYNQKPGSLPQTQRTAPNDPYHPTASGVKQKSDYTIFTTPKDSMTMRQRFVSGPKETTFKGLPMQKKPELGKAPVEYWKKYAEKGGREAIHPGSRITDIQTATPGSGLGLFGAQRKELKQRISSGLKNPKGIPTLKQQIKSARGGSSTLSNVGRGVEASPSGLKFTPGTGGNYGASGIGLAN